MLSHVCRSILLPLLLVQTVRAAGNRTLLRGGTFITYNSTTADLDIINDGAMLFDERILAIARTPDGLDGQMDDGVQVVNTTGKIVSPGFIDTHRHTWQTAMRTLGPNVQLGSYFWLFSASGPPALLMTPDDVFIGELMGTLEGLNAGVTTTVDFAHMTWSREHAESALQGVLQSGARAYWCYEIMAVTTGADPFTVNLTAPVDQIAHITELAQSDLFDGGLVKLGIAFDSWNSTDPLSKEVIDLARNLSVELVTAHDVGGPFGIGNIVQIVNDIPSDPPALNSSFAMIFAHMSDINETSASLLREFDQYFSITPESEMHYGHGHPQSFMFQDQGSLGVDTHFTFSIDIITQMRIWLQSTRLPLYQDVLNQNKIPSDTPMSVKQAFLLGTRNGGLALRRPDLGVLQENAVADVLVFSTDAVGLIGWSDPVAAIVLHSNVRDIEDIYVNGTLVKQGGNLVLDWQGQGFGDRLRESAERFRNALNDTFIQEMMQGITEFFDEPPSDFQVPFQVDVTRGNGTGF